MFQKLFSKNKSPSDSGYQIADILYLVNWKPYLKILGKSNPKAIIEIYVYRIWLYNYIFRRAVSDIDEISNKMLYQLINEIKTIGNPIFVEVMIGTNTSREEVNSLSEMVMDKIYKALEYYDGIAIKHKDNKKDFEAVMLHFALEIGLRPLEDENDAKTLACLQELFNKEILSVVPSIAINAVKNEMA